MDVKQDSSKTESLLTGKARTSASGRKRVPKETINIPKATPLSQPNEVKSVSSEYSSTVTDLLSVEDQSVTEYKHEMKILSQAGSLVRESEDPHSPIWLKGFDYPAQYLVRQTRSMSAKISTQSSDTDATRPKETKVEDASGRRDESLQQCGGKRKRERGRKRKTKRDSPDSTDLPTLHRDDELQQQSCSSSSCTCSDLEELIVSIPICGNFPISVRHASKALQQDSTSTCTPPEAQRQDVQQLVFPKPTSSPQPVEDFYLPDEGFQALKLDKLQSVQQFGEKLRRKLKPSKLMSSKLRHGFSDTYSSQSEVESCTFTADVCSEVVSCVVGSDSDSQLPFTEAEQEMLNVGTLSSRDMFVSCSLCDVSTSTSLHCVCNRMDGSEVAKTARLRHVVCLHRVSEEVCLVGRPVIANIPTACTFWYLSTFQISLHPIFINYHFACLYAYTICAHTRTHAHTCTQHKHTHAHNTCSSLTSNLRPLLTTAQLSHLEPCTLQLTQRPPFPMWLPSLLGKYLCIWNNTSAVEQHLELIGGKTRGVWERSITLLKIIIVVRH